MKFAVVAQNADIKKAKRLLGFLRTTCRVYRPYSLRLTHQVTVMANCVMRVYARVLSKISYEYEWFPASPQPTHRYQ